MKAGVVIVAAGRGERLGHRLRKAMVPVGGRPMMLRAAEAFVRTLLTRGGVISGVASDLTDNERIAIANSLMWHNLVRLV